MSIAVRRTISGILSLLATGVLAAEIVTTGTAENATPPPTVSAGKAAAGDGSGTPTPGRTPDPTWGWD
ncbi:hypothetical protein [Kitasatospora sp. NPDC089509]|uniref:hypothetical protein n=1 Tax=Kitasatospora sp. NPDC089509 TaxID=3364079 RepID=UPI0038132FE2